MQYRTFDIQVVLSFMNEPNLSLKQTLACGPTFVFHLKLRQLHVFPLFEAGGAGDLRVLAFLVWGKEGQKELKE